MTTLAFTAAPSQVPHYLRALLARKRSPGAGEQLPPIDATLTVTPAPEVLATYRHLCGFRDGAVPISFPHVLASPLHLAILTHPSFPLPAMGLLHVANQIVQHRALLEGEPLSLRVALAGQREARRGLEFDLRSEVRVASELVWESVSTLLHRLPGRAPPRAQADAPIAPAPALHAASSEEWALPAGLGRRYARVSGDFNPIHLWPLSARLFGFRRPIIHGMWTLARAAAALADRAPALPSKLEVRFKRPLALPGAARLSAREAGGALSFRVADRAGEEIFLEGTWSPLRE